MELEEKHWIINTYFYFSAIVSTKFTGYRYIKRKQVEEFLSIIAEKLNTDITSVWLSNDGEYVQPCSKNEENSRIISVYFLFPHKKF